MITRLFFKNFRAFEDIDLPLTKINLFVGPNNSGKSAILSAINLLSQTLDSADRDVPLLLSGKFEDLGTYQDVVYKNEIERDISLGLEFSIYPLLEKRSPFKEARINVIFHYRKQRREIVVESVELSIPPGDIFLRTRVAKVSKNQLIEKIREKSIGIKTGPSSSGSIILNHYIPSLTPRLGRRWFPRTGKRYAPYRKLDLLLYIFAKSLFNHLGGVEFIGPFRKSPERTYPFSGETPSVVGVHGENAVSILVSDESRRRGQKRNLSQNISDWLRRSEIAKGIRIAAQTERYLEVIVTHFDTSENENIADVGYGCSQILPILVAGYHRPSDSSLIIAEPEIHLHPKAEAEIGSFLYEVSKRKIQLFVETHSEHLILRLLSHVASGELSPQDVNVFCVFSDAQSGKKHCKRMSLRKDGFFEEEWPRGFFPERLEEAKRLAKFSV
jgi:predicted ATPase